MRACKDGGRSTLLVLLVFTGLVRGAPASSAPGPGEREPAVLELGLLGLDALGIGASAPGAAALGGLDPSALEPNSLRPNSLRPNSLRPNSLGPGALESSALGSSALVAVGPAGPSAPPQSAASQDKDEVFEKVDPYTKGDAAAMEKAGYESFGPFLFAQGIKTQDVEEALGNIQVLWLETKHFKLGSTLRTYKYKGDPKEEKRLDEELKRLKARLPNVKPVKNKLDPWLRLHLYAQRLEEQYADFLQRFGFTEADFDPKTRPASLAMGEGPFLGMEMKYTVLITEKRSGTARFLKRFLDTETPSWQRWNLPGGSYFLAISMEALKEYNYDSELALWATTSSEMAMNFLEGFRKAGPSVPMWFRAGYAHVCARRVDERYTVSAVGTTKSLEDEDAARWEPRVYGLVFNKAAKPWKDMAAWTKWDDLKAQGHLVAWSRVAWLLERKDTKLRELLLGLTEGLRDVPEADRARVALERQEAALQAALGKSVADAEAEWRQFVLKTYARK